MKLFTNPAIFFAMVLLALSALADAADRIPLRAGPLTMEFDTDNVFLRYVRVGQQEVLRGITAPIRDAAWATVAPKLSNLQIEDHGDSFEVSFDVRCQQANIDFQWKGTLTGTAAGVVEYQFDGEALSTFQRNRIGFCVLHGPSAAGQPWVIETADGKAAPGKFPKFVSPQQPAKNLRAITHEVAPGIRARVEFEGEVFEMEDQRNWTDASFKTYGTPLEIPYPVEVPQGTKISQKVTISLAGNTPDASQSTQNGTVLTLEASETALPRLGVQVSSEVVDLTEVQLERLKALHLDHLRVDLALSQASFVDELRRATEQAHALGISLHVGLNLGDAPDFATLLQESKKLKPPVSVWLVTGVNPAHFDMAHKQLAPLLGPAIIGVSETTNFVELNRTRPQNKSVEALGFGINPQIHAFDNASMVETLPIHAEVINSTREFAGDAALIIGPITLAPQFVDGVDPPGGPLPGPLPTYVDGRQVEPFAAAWTLGSLKFIAEAGADSVTYFETVGWKGVMDADDVSSRPAAFPSHAGQTFPVYDLLKEIGQFAGGRVRQIDSSDTLSAVGLALHKPGQLRVLLGNLSGEPQTVTLRGLIEESVTVELLGSTQSNVVPEIRIDLPPYGIAHIDRVVD